MKFVTVSSGRLVELNQWERESSRKLATGLRELDQLYEPGGLTRGVIHEFLYPLKSAKPLLPALYLASAIATPIKNQNSKNDAGVIVISDPQRRLYPPAAAQLGIPLQQLYLLHPRTKEQELWAISECLASSGVAAVLASLGKLTQLEARRLQLAAERGNSFGLLLRPVGPISSIYAAATRTLVTPVLTGPTSQSWTFQLLHGHGQLGATILLEYNREEHTLHTSSQLARRQAPAKAKRHAG